MKFVIILCFILIACEKKDKTVDVTTNALKTEKKAVVELVYSTPENWIAEDVKTSMRKAQYAIPGKSSDLNGEMAVFYFPEMDVMPTDNLDRWIRQFKSKSGNDIQDDVERQDFEIKDMKINYIKVDGTFKKSLNPFMPNAEVEELDNYTMLAAIINTKGGPWFFKAVGPSETMLNEKAKFEAMILSVK